MADRAFEGNQFDNPQLSHVAVANISYQAELMESFSSYESGMRLYRLFVKYLRNSSGRSLVADEKAALVTLARNASTHIQRADTFLELSNELVQLAPQLSSDGIEKTYAALLASDQYSPLFKERLRERVEESGGIRPFVAGSTSRAKIVLASVHERLQRELEEIEQGQVPNREAFDSARAVGEGVEDNSLFEGGWQAVGIGLATTIAAATITAPIWVVGGLAAAGGFIIGFGAMCVYESLN